MSITMVSVGPTFLSVAEVKIRHHDRPVLAFVGDDTLHMLDVHNLATVAMRRSEWSDPRLVVIVLHSSHWRAGWPDPLPESFDEPPPEVQCFDYAGYARLLGLSAFTVHNQAEFSAAWDLAAKLTSPVLIDVHADPNVIDWETPEFAACEPLTYLEATFEGEAERDADINIGRLLH
jgi:pyruvate dehydrogenase (quinone)